MVCIVLLYTYACNKVCNKLMFSVAIFATNFIHIYIYIAYTYVRKVCLGNFENPFSVDYDRCLQVLIGKISVRYDSVPVKL